MNDKEKLSLEFLNYVEAEVNKLKNEIKKIDEAVKRLNGGRKVKKISHEKRPQKIICL